jgi:hypothetical protein
MARWGTRLLTGYLEDITSDRKLVEQCSMRMDILYFLRFDIDVELPWHSTISRTRKPSSALFKAIIENLQRHLIPFFLNQVISTSSTDG